MSTPKSTLKPQGALLISPAGEDHQIFSELFRRQGWALGHASSIGAASELLGECPTSIVITERELVNGNWKDVLEAMRALPAPPLVIVISQLADDYLWAEALNLGVYDVLAKPLNLTEIVRVLSLALNHPNETSSRQCCPAPPADQTKTSVP